MEPYWNLIKRIITESDIILEILDSRLVELSRNKQIEKLIKEINRPVIFVINKTDLVLKQSLNKKIKKLKMHGEIVFISTKKKNANILISVIKKVFKKYGKRKAIVYEKYASKPKYKEAVGEIVVGVLGYPNVGKSSIINLLAYKKKVKVSKKSGTTHGIHWVKGVRGVKLIDSPGVIPLEENNEIKYGLIGAMDNERLKNPEILAYTIIKLFMKKNKKTFEKFYKINIQNKNSEEIIKLIAEKKGYLLKGGIFDENRAITLIIRDWQEGKLRL